MRARTLAILGLTGFLAGCFSEPEAAGDSSGGTSTGATSPSTSGSAGDDTSTSDEPSESTTTGNADSGTSFGDSGSSGTGPELECTFNPAEPRELRAEVVIMLDPSTQIAWDGLRDTINAFVAACAVLAIVLTGQVLHRRTLVQRLQAFRYSIMVLVPSLIALAIVYAVEARIRDPRLPITRGDAVDVNRLYDPAR